VITLEELKKIMPYAGRRTEFYLDHLNAAMDEFSIDTPQRQAAFLAQIAHESGSLNYVKELASGKDYEGRRDLGNTEAGDGVRYKGRGLIQITGRANYRACGEALGIGCVELPELLEIPENATRSAGWFWQSRGLNEIADKGDFLLITRKINGGTNGYKDRLAYYERAQEVLA
jgi:putative chitinase